MTESFNRKLGRLAQSVSGTGSITTNAATASAWETARTITLGGDLSGSVSIDGTSNVSLTATVSGDSIVLGTDTTGDYVAAVAVSGTGLSVSGSGENATYTITSNATSANTASTIVARDASGNFSAGTITAALTGNASTATTLQTARTINGVSFNGSGDITVTAAAGTLTGNTLASGVTSSSLTSVGTLSSLTVSGDLTVDTNTLFVDSANNRVGIGTASPTVALTAISATGGQPVARIQNTDVNGFPGIEFADAAGNTDLYIGLEQGGGAARLNSLDGGFRFYTSGNERMRIDASGNLGIAETPKAWVDAKSVTVGKAGSLYGDGLTAGWKTGLAANAYRTGLTTWAYANTGVQATRIEMEESIPFAVYTAPSGTAGNAISFTQAMTLDASGNLGVGTTSPSVRLDVQTASAVGGITLTATTGTNGAAIHAVNTGGSSYFGRNNSTGGAFGGTAYATVVYGGGAYPMAFYTNDTERMRIDASGNLGIGTTSPSGKLDVRGNVYAGIGAFNNAMSATTALALSTATIGQATGIEFYANDGVYNPRVWIVHTHSASTSLLTFNSTFSDGTGFANFAFLNGNVGIGTTNPSTTLHVNGNTRTDVVFGASHYSGTVATNISAGQSGFWCVATNTGGSGEPASQMIIDVIASSWTVWNLCRIIIDKRYDSSTVVASITGYTNSTVTVSVVTVNVGGTNYIAIRRTGGDPGLVVHAIQNGQGLISAFHTTSGTVVTTHASYP